MSYAQYGLIQASDLNTLAGGNPTTTPNTLNAVWATGGSAAGYGQTPVANVAAGQSVAATGQWAAIVSNTASAASHQGTSITSVAVPVSGGVITYTAAIPTNINSIYAARLNAAGQGSTSANTVSASTWSNQLNFAHTVTFANGDAARYFFNAGGQIKMTFSGPTANTLPQDQVWNTLAQQCATVAISAPSSGTAVIAGVTYNGVTRVGGSGATPVTLATNSGYFAQTTSNVEIFKQVTQSGTGAYAGSYISVTTKTNGTQGSNGDAGSVYNIYTQFDEPDANTNAYTVSSGCSTTCTIVPPSTTYIANTWGAITVTGTVSGS